MNESTESVLRFINLTSAGLLAGSLGFGESPLTPGWEKELPQEWPHKRGEGDAGKYFNAIGPIALVSGLALAIGSTTGRTTRRALDVAAAVGLAGVVAATTLVTIPITRKLDTAAPAVDYERADSTAMTRNWTRAHATRTALGIGAFVCAAASLSIRKR